MESETLNLLRSQLHRPDLTLETPLLDEGILDSLAFVDVVFRIEQDLALSIPIDQVDLEVFSTPLTLAQYLRGLAVSG